MDKDQMPKVNLTSDSKLSNVHIFLMKDIEKKNFKRVQDLNKLRRSNKILGSVLGVFAVSVYCYTIYTVKQEKFLDDFDEPEKEIIPPKVDL